MRAGFFRILFSAQEMRSREALLLRDRALDEHDALGVVLRVVRVLCALFSELDAGSVHGT